MYNALITILTACINATETTQCKTDTTSITDYQGHFYMCNISIDHKVFNMWPKTDGQPAQSTLWDQKLNDTSCLSSERLAEFG